MYITQICTYLSKYFDNISIIRQKIRPYESAYVFCTNFSNAPDVKLLSDTIAIWNSSATNLFLFQNEDPNIKPNLNAIRNRINKSIVKKELIYDSKIDDVAKLSLDEMIKHHTYNNKVNLHRSILVAQKYNLKLRPDVVFKIKKLNFTFDAPINITFLRISNKITNIDTLIDQGAKLKLYKSGIDSMDQIKWQTIVQKLDITRLIPIKLNKTVDFCKMYEVCYVNKLMNKKLQTLHICHHNDEYVKAINFVNKEHIVVNDTASFANSIDLFTSDSDSIDETIVDLINTTVKIGGAAILKLTVPFINLQQIGSISEHFNDVSFYKPLVGSPIVDDVFIILKNKREIPSDKYQMKADFIDNMEHVSNVVIDLQISKMKTLFDAYSDLYATADVEKYAEEYYLKWSQYFDIKSFVNISA